MNETEPEYPLHPELAVASVLHLATRYSSTRNPALAQAAVAQLRVIAEDERLAPGLRQCARQLVGDWQRMSLPRHPVRSAD